MKKLLTIGSLLVLPILGFSMMLLVLLVMMLGNHPSSNSTTITGSGSPPVTGTALQVATNTYQTLIQKEKVMPAGAAGALAVEQRESGFDPQAVNLSGGVAGDFQWSGWNNTINGSRLTTGGFIIPQDLSSLTQQNEMALMDAELNGSYAKVKTLMAHETDPVQAAKDWSQYYEGVSLSDGQTNLSEITQLAQQWQAYFSGSGSNKGAIASLNALLGKTVGSGQCYALSNYYVQSLSQFTLQGMDASQIGSDNLAAFQTHGWTVIFHPRASQLTVGSVVNWGAGPESGTLSQNPYGHTGVISAVNGKSFTTYEQNWNNVQIVQQENRVWDNTITSICIPPQ
jgi:hypothetical protein